MSSVTSKPTLYDRLGGVYSIAAVVDDFIDRVMHNPVLNAHVPILLQKSFCTDDRKFFWL
jgi:truncated hemoglobin YjbI